MCPSDMCCSTNVNVCMYIGVYYAECALVCTRKAGSESVLAACSRYNKTIRWFVCEEGVVEHRKPWVGDTHLSFPVSHEAGRQGTEKHC